MTSPTLVQSETINGVEFTTHRALFVTPSGGCGVRYIHRINRKTVKKSAWTVARDGALLTEQELVGGGAYDPIEDFNYVGSRHHY